MLSKMAQSNNVAGGGGGGSAPSGRRVPLSLSSGSGAVTRIQQSAGSNGRSNSPQNSSTSTNKKNEQQTLNLGNGPFISLKKTSIVQQKASSSTAAAAKDEEKKGQNGVGKSTNSSSSKAAAQNGNTNAAAKEQPKPKEKQAENKETSIRSEAKQEEPAEPAVKEPEVEANTATVNESKKNKASVPVIIDLDNDPDDVIVPATPPSERKSSRRVSTANQQKTPNKSEKSESETESLSPAQKKQPEQSEEVKKAAELTIAEDVEMESLAVEASPIRASVAIAQPAATSTPGRNLFGFRSASKQQQTNEIELAAQPSSSPASVPARSFAQISGRRSIRTVSTLTPGKLGNYRCLNTSELDSSNCTNTSMNATVGSEIPNSSSFSFSFFGRGRKRERTPPILSGSQSTNDLALDVEMSPPKRARFELFSLNLASPFSMLRSRFSKATLNSPSTRLNQTPPAGEDEEGEKGEVQNVSGIVIQEEEEQQQLNKSSASNGVPVGQEAGLETPKKSGSPVKKDIEADDAELKDIELKKVEQADDAVANLPSPDAEVSTEIEGPNRSRCAIM